MVILNGQICDPSKEGFYRIIQFAAFCQGTAILFWFADTALSEALVPLCGVQWPIEVDIKKVGFSGTPPYWWDLDEMTLLAKGNNFIQDLVSWPEISLITKDYLDYTSPANVFLICRVVKEFGSTLPSRTLWIICFDFGTSQITVQIVIDCAMSYFLWLNLFLCE